MKTIRPKLPVSSRIPVSQLIDHDVAIKEWNKVNRKPWTKYVPIKEKAKANKGDKVKIFGITKSGYKNPSVWTLNTPNSKKTNLGRAHYAYLTNPEFQINKSGMYQTRGIKIPTEKDYVTTNTRGADKIPYAFINGTVQRQGLLKDNVNANNKVDVLSMPNVRGGKYKVGGLSKVSAEDMLQGKSDSFVGYGMVGKKPKGNKSPKRLVGREEFNTLSKEERRKVYLVSGIRLAPNGQMHYYNRHTKLTKFLGY